MDSICLNKDDCLNKGDKLKLYNIENKSSSREFEICENVSDNGGSTICYKAKSEGIDGVLKEFCPFEYRIDLKRYENGFFIEESEAEDFKNKRDEYYNSYKTLMEKRSNSNSDMDSFIPSFEIYESRVDDKKLLGTYYYWTSIPKLKTFKEVCEEMKNDEETKPLSKLIKILSVIKALTECTKILHIAGFIHYDIKPENFGFSKRNNEILPETIQWFDLNSLRKVREEIPMGTEGYFPGGVKIEDKNKIDIYSIGATLFYALTNNSFSGVKKEDIENNVTESKIIKDLGKDDETLKNETLKKSIINILKKCFLLGYASCEDLFEDVYRVWRIALSISSEFKEYNDLIDKNIFNVLLYDHPLYEFANNNKINLLIYGFDSYSQKFLDVSLQMGQMVGWDLNVTVLDEDNNRDGYLKNRIGLKEFFKVEDYDNKKVEDYDNKKVEDYDNKKVEDDSYGTINFIESIDSIKIDKFNYVFISTGHGDNENRDIANVYAEKIKKCSICYICTDNGKNKDGKNKDGEYKERIHPIYVNKEIESASYPEIERMALNTHLIWEKNLNVDFNEIKKAFNDPYNRNSSILSVVSLKYKLHSIGLKIEDPDVAEKFNSERNRPGVEIVDKLAYIEHRRWNTEKLCAGWKKMEVDESVKTRKTKDTEKKEHICILRSKPNRNLSKQKLAFWDENNDLKNPNYKLDELEQMSVRLHREYNKKVNEINKNNWFSELNNIQSELTDEKSIMAFLEWRACIVNIKNLNNENRKTVKLYEGLKTDFLNAVNEVDRENIKNLIDLFEQKFYYIRLSKEYRDWKQDDIALIDNIPFILTYTEKVCMVIPFNVNKKDIFKNVAAATVVNPEKIIYIYKYDEGTFEEFKEAAKLTLKYIDKKKLKTSIKRPNFIIVGDDKNKIKKVKCSFNKEQVASSGLNENLLKKKNKIKDYIFAIEKNEVYESSFEKDLSLENFASYKFDIDKIEFSECNKCELFSYIKKKPFITVSDVLAIGDTINEGINQPQFYENYNDLWKYCRDNVNSFKKLSGILSGYNNSNKYIFSFDKTNLKKNKAKYEDELLEYIIPSECYTSVKRILNGLKEEGIINEEYSIIMNTTDSYKISFKPLRGSKLKEKMNALLYNNIHKLMNDSFIEVIPHYTKNKNKRCFGVIFDDLQVSNLNLVQIDGVTPEDMYSILKRFSEEGFIYNLEKKNKKGMIVSFTYASRSIKDLLVNAGRVLEIYVYHKLKQSGLFDDVVSAYEVKWGKVKNDENGKRNEFDCIVTKGFNVFAIECKFKKVDGVDNTIEKLEAKSNNFILESKTVLVEYRDNSDGEVIENSKSIIIRNSKVMIIDEILQDISSPKKGK